MQLNTSLDDKLLTLNDVALSTDNFLVSADGRIKQNGDIKYLKLNILDKNGCAIIEQELKGNIKKPSAVNTTTAIIGLASKIPSSLLGTGKKLVNFSTKTIDGIASFALNTTHISDEKVSLTSDITQRTGSILKSTSDIVLPNECKVIYRGKVKHPKQMK